MITTLHLKTLAQSRFAAKIPKRQLERIMYTVKILYKVSTWMLVK